MTFRDRCISLHRPGNPRPTIGEDRIGVEYDGTIYVYEIEEFEIEDFAQWAVNTWADIHGDHNVTEDPYFDSYRRILSVDSF